MTVQTSSVGQIEMPERTVRSDSTESTKHGRIASSSSASRGLAESGERFSVVLEKARGSQPENTALQRSLETFTDNWRSSERKLEQLVKTVPSSVRGVVELQVLVNRVHLQSELLARSADGVANSVKRLHQMGSG